jgi:hypothetical protein
MATKKSSPKKSKKESTDNNSNVPKALGLFDHVNHIRGTQNPKYFSTLSDADKKSFAHVMLMKFLSMDRNALDSLSYIGKYQDSMPSENFYTVLIAVTPRSNQFYKYIKAGKNKYDDEFYQLLAKWYECSSSEAEEYSEILCQTDEGIQEMINICKAYGLTDKEVESLMTNEK